MIIYELNILFLKTNKHCRFSDISTGLKFTTPIPEKFLGEFEVGVDGEYTNEGRGHTTYYFTITKNGIVLKSVAFRGNFLCEGKL